MDRTYSFAKVVVLSCAVEAPDLTAAIAKADEQMYNLAERLEDARESDGSTLVLLREGSWKVREQQ